MQDKIDFVSLDKKVRKIRNGKKADMIGFKAGNSVKKILYYKTDVIQKESPEKNLEEIQYYLVDQANPIGEGGYGVVYKAYPIDEDGTVEGDVKKIKVVKEIDLWGYDNVLSGKKQISKEVEYGKNKSQNKAVYLNPDDDETAFILMDYVPGIEPKPENLQTITPYFQPLSFPQQIQAIMELCMAVNLTHHHTPTTGPALVHKDIKPNNIRMQVTANQQNLIRINVSLLDFGVSDTIEDTVDAKKKSPIAGTPKYEHPWFATTGTLSPKADLYALSFVIFNILKNLRSIPPEYWPLHRYLLEFLHLMSQTDYDKQPDTDAVLKFFTLMNQVCLRFQAVQEYQKLEKIEVIEDVSRIEDFAFFKRQFKFLIAWGDLEAVEIICRINTALEDEKWGDFSESKKAIKKYLDQIQKFQKPKNRLYALTWLEARVLNFDQNFENEILLSESFKFFEQKYKLLREWCDGEAVEIICRINTALEDEKWGDFSESKKAIKKYLDQIQKFQKPKNRLYALTWLNETLLSESKSFQYFEQKYELLREWCDGEAVDIICRINKALEDKKWEDLPEFKKIIKTFLETVKTIEEPEDRIEPLTLLENSLSDYNRNSFVSAENLSAMSEYSLRCKGRPSSAVRFVGIGMTSIGIVFIGLGTLSLLVSMGIIATGFLAPLGAIGMAASIGMIVGGGVAGLTGFGLFANSNAKGVSASAQKFVDQANKNNFKHSAS